MPGLRPSARTPSASGAKRGPQDRQALREKCAQTAAYISKRRAYMDYATYLAKGLMIGSGIIESSHKRLIAGRLKQAGMHWSLEGANAITYLRFAPVRRIRLGTAMEEDDTGLRRATG